MFACSIPLRPASRFLGSGPQLRHRRVPPTRVVSTAALGARMLSLGGCTSAAEMATRHRQACVTYGFQPGTEAYANCLLQLDVSDYGLAHHGRAALAMPHPSSPPPPAAPPRR